MLNQLADRADARDVQGVGRQGPEETATAGEGRDVDPKGRATTRPAAGRAHRLRAAAA
jgi:hypothetical protein